MSNLQGPIGMVFASKYEIVKLLGKGGMANVYLAEDKATGVNVAIKILKPEYSNDEEFIRRFDAEAKAVSSLNQSNIVKVFGVGHEGNFRYIVQEYVEGITVKELINQNGHLDWKVAVPIAIQVCIALGYAHENGIVHRDIKPQNILISRDRIAKVTDFGIARASTNSTITMTSGGAMGSVHYFSPEQARGGNVGPASDIYSVGVMLFEMVTGRVPFDGDSNVAIAVKHLQEKVPTASTLVPGIPNGLDSIINKCMQKTAEKRYSSMRQLVTELDALMVDPSGVYGVISEDVDDEDISVSFRQDPKYDKISDLEKSAELSRRSRIRDNIILVLIIVCIVGVLIGLGVLVVSAVRNSTNIQQTTDYTVRDYVGLTIDEVTDELDQNSIRYTIEYEQSDTVVPGIVLAQSIQEGIVISANSSVSNLVLTVSSAGDELPPLTDYTGLDYLSAAQSISALGLNANIRSEITDDMSLVGKVIRTEPEAGAQLQAGDSVIIIYGVESSNTVVPQIPNRNNEGLTLAQAKTLISEANLVVGQVEGSADVLALPQNQQYVMSFSPAPGTQVPKGSSIKIVVGTRDDFMHGGTPTPTPVEYQITVNVNGSGGTVSGGGTYAPGTQVVLTATPTTGNKFDYWVDPWGNTISSSSYTVTVGQGDATYTAFFSAAATPTPVPTATPVPATPTPSPVPPPEVDPIVEPE